MKETLLSLIKEWIKPGTTIYSDAWKSFDFLADVDYEYLKVNYIYFVDPETQCHTITSESKWHHIKASLPTYNIKCDFRFYLAELLYRASCEEKKIDAFNIFLELFRELDWTKFAYAD
ncbi:DDE_Tnp_IS1595 domain-containing protein [Nephila pilipes]|uniref:DDE_Tnp_IS1595 domain-containing protein n=1 Tax=Nephila pilipes TaxID=299642 RepID=A0A8X6NBK4_NEPPI|nr:DDE_Tnp_IS1595 domain-containing protein [Nephila pilipes]GFT05143.1 DDE_Tnp_IS1595 domain-containing protein [Nephila pilipes]GFT15026.1 DDE_Tnp_IS1595 domain-containing protein [Nephila pilipes]